MSAAPEMDAWGNGWRCNPVARAHEVSRAVSVVLACIDENQLTIRSTAADLALISARRSVTTQSLAIAPIVRRHIRQRRARQLLNGIDPWLATREAFDYSTELPADLVWLIGSDQISANTFVGTTPSEQITPLLRAVDLNGGWRHAGRGTTLVAGSSSTDAQLGQISTIQHLPFELLHTERRRLHVSRIPNGCAEPSDVCANRTSWELPTINAMPRT